MISVRQLILICTFFVFQQAYAQEYCAFDNEVRSKRLANYVMNLSLDHESKTVTGTQQIEWINNSPDTVTQVEMYMYLNAFKNVESSYISGSVRNVMGQDLSGKPAEDWGYIRLNSIKERGSDQELNQRYIQNLDNNDKDQSVVQIDLTEPIAPGGSLILDTEFVSKLPRTIARVGFAENNFHFFVHWYPKLGVYEPDESGRWGWNCHQFLQRMEFYGEFGTYDMTITTSDEMKVGGSGCRIAQDDNGNGTTTHHFIANDVIDFAWVAYPDFEIYHDNWNGIDIELFSPAHHKRLVPRIIGAVKNSLAFMETHVGPYPYPKITVMDPPALGMRSGFMEYPTFITGGSFYGFPKGVKSLESLIVHEFCHQYFMGMLANNEKEAPWLDEGFVTFFEDNVMEAYYGDEENSLVDILGYHMSNSAKSRNEYVGMRDRRASTITENSWKIKGDYKGLIYAKTSMILRSMKHIMGDDIFYRMMQIYFKNNQFTHPRKANFVELVKSYSSVELEPFEFNQVLSLLDLGLETTAVCDYAITNVESSIDPSGSTVSTITVEQLEDFYIPVDLRFTFEDGSVIDTTWNQPTDRKEFILNSDSPLMTAEIDPDHKLWIDINLNNNSYTSNSSPFTIVKYFSRAVYWTQNLMQTMSFLM